MKRLGNYEKIAEIIFLFAMKANVLQICEVKNGYFTLQFKH